MQGQGNYSSLLDQTQATSQPPYQQHVPGSFPPRSPIQNQVMPCPSVNQTVAISSYASNSTFQLHGHDMGKLPTAHHVQPPKGPAGTLSSAVPTSLSPVNPLQWPPIPGNMPVSSTHLNAQPSSHYYSHTGNQNVQQILTPGAGIARSDSSPSVPLPRLPPPPPIQGQTPGTLSRMPPPPPIQGQTPGTLPRLPPPPPIQGQTTNWSLVNSQSTHIGAAKGVLHPVTSSTGSVVHTIPGQSHFSSSAFPQPHTSSLLQPFHSLPSISHSSSPAVHSSSNFQQQCKSEESIRNSSMDPTQMRSDAPVIDQTDRKVKSAVGSGFIVAGGFAENVHAAPPKPTDKRVIQNIEILCQFIAKNGLGFEDMARKRESQNPEFKFLFGGEPGTEAGIAHDYFQWLKKKYCSTVNFPEGENHAPSQNSEICSPRQPEKLTLASISDACADSDMEMEDDITLSNEDRESNQRIQDLSCGPDFVHMKMDSNRLFSVAHQTVHAAAPHSGSATFYDQGKGGTTGNLMVLDDHILSSSTACEHTNFGKSVNDTERPFRILPESYPSDTGLENDYETTFPEIHSETVGSSAAVGPIDVPKKSDVDTRPEISNKVENASGELLGSAGVDSVSINCLQFETGLKESDTTSYAPGLINGNESNGKGLVKAIPPGKYFNEGVSRSATEHSNESTQTMKENKDYNFRSSSTALKVDEFGRLVREGISDSDSDDSYLASRHNKRGIVEARVRTSGYRRRRHGGEYQMRAKRSLSRSWSPRRRSRSRSTRRRRSRSKSPVRLRSRSRSPRRHGSRSRSPWKHTGQFRRVNLRRGRGPKPECFNFLRGRCYRGSSCRYLHHDAETDGSNHRRWGPQNNEFPSDFVRSDATKEIYDKSDVSDRVDDESMKQRSHYSLSMHSGSSIAIEVQKEKERSDLDTIEKDERGAGDLLQQGTISDVVEDLSTGSLGNPNLFKIYHPNVVSGASHPLQPYPLEDFPSAKLSNIQPHLSCAPPSCTLDSVLASDMSGGYIHYQHSHTNFDSHDFLKRHPSLMQSEVQNHGLLSSGIPTDGCVVGSSLTRESLISSCTNSFPTVNVPSNEPSRPSQVHSYTHLLNRDTSAFDVPKQMTTLHPQDTHDLNQTSFAHGNGGCRVNPYVSKYEQPLVSRSKADILPQNYLTQFQYKTPQDIQDDESEQSSSVKSAARIQQSPAQPEGDQYDPLFDSIEPSMSIEKVNHSQKQESMYGSGVMLSMGGSNRPLDVEENNKKKSIEAFVPSTLPDDDGFGETADADVGDVEDASPNNHIDLIDETNDIIGEDDIDGVYSLGKECKEPRSTKLFKIALANFVKEVLRPSWRQGNMSKEAFKTIVKKTVDKVTGAMKSHHIPKSQSKINHYIDSSKQKLTKLVMGYVHKYVKV
ncbi:hypothetical protein SAY86_006943 [Trapa natans]|uniref:C3H1-type domain-containing protein n=1 Tax=Trapa natans TaxID=22666 RepID=A0AAN7L6R2_TRANT|nr:hypothetical protein SAY86_006943 [Trapa natans]